MAVEFRAGRHHQAADNELRVSEDHRQPRRGVDRLEFLEERLVLRLLRTSHTLPIVASSTAFILEHRNINAGTTDVYFLLPKYICIFEKNQGNGWSKSIDVIVCNKWKISGTAAL